MQLVFRVTRQRMTEALFHVTWRALLSSLLFHHETVSPALVKGKADEIVRQPTKVFALVIERSLDHIQLPSIFCAMSVVKKTINTIFAMNFRKQIN